MLKSLQRVSQKHFCKGYKVVKVSTCSENTSTDALGHVITDVSWHHQVLWVFQHDARDAFR